MKSFNVQAKDFDHLKSTKYLLKLGDSMYGNIKLYQCKDRHTNEQTLCNELFVVKKCYKSEDDYTQKVKALRNEFLIGQLLDHPNIIKTLGYDSERDALILEHCVGQDLFDYTNRRKYWNIRVLRKFLPVFSQVLDAVCYLHDKGIAHYDIKVENIMYDKLSNCVKLIDFGNADFFVRDGKRVSDNVMKGTIEYLPPDVFTSPFFYGDNVDVWSVGIVLYRLIYNDLPWKKAVLSDSSYSNCRVYFREQRLPPKFYDLKMYGYTENDTKTIKSIFVKIFSECQPSIKWVNDTFKTLDALKE